MTPSTTGNSEESTEFGTSTPGADQGLTLGEVTSTLRARIKLLVLAPLAAGLLALGITTLIPPTYTATTTLLPPQQTQGGAATALASLGALAGLAGNATGIASSGDRYVALMQSATVADRLIDQFKLMGVFEAKFRVDARTALAANVRISFGKKDGLITVDVDDTSPQRAADIANRYVDELRRITGTLAVTEAQQRRVFFERQLQTSKERLVQAQETLQASGFNAGALKAEPKAAAEGYARLKAEATAAEVRIQALRGNLADNTPEVRQQQATLSALREQLARVERATDTKGSPDYIGKYREFKYQETLFELYARQFELARVDESKEGALIQVVDPAMPPEKKSKPKRAMIAGIATLAAGALLTLWVVLRESGRRTSQARRPSAEQHAG